MLVQNRIFTAEAPRTQRKHFLFGGEMPPNKNVSSLETVEHLDFLFETESLKDKDLYNQLSNEYQELNSMLYRFIGSVELQHDTTRVGQIGH